MTKERILEMLTNDSYLKVKNTAKNCKLPTTGSKMNIFMRLLNRQLNPEPQSDCETDNTSIDGTSDSQEVNADHKESPSSFKNST